MFHILYPLFLFTFLSCQIKGHANNLESFSSSDNDKQNTFQTELGADAIESKKCAVKLPSSCCPPTLEEECSFQEQCSRSLSHTVNKGFIVQASYLFYQALEDGLDFVQDSIIGGGFPDPVLANLNLLEPDFSWNNGIQVGVGYIFPQREQWDLLLNWTYYQTHSKNSISADFANAANHTLRPIWLPFLMGTAASEASVHWLMHFNTLDLSLGRDFFIGSWLSMHPKAGLRGAWLYQGYQSSYQGGYSVNAAPIFPLGITSFTGNWKYEAGGLRLGSDAEWLFSKNFSLFANLFGSLLYGKFTVDESFNGGFVIDGGGSPIMIPEIITVHKDYFRVRPVLETELGIRWQYFFSCDQRRAMIGAYYGLSYWFNQNALVNEFLTLDLASGNAFFTKLAIEGDLQLHGLRIEAALDF